jgi:hypothetical protein
MPAGPGSLGQQRREALHPPVGGDVVDLDATLGQEVFDLAVRQTQAQLLADRDDKAIGWGAEAGDADGGAGAGPGQRVLMPAVSLLDAIAADATVPSGEGRPRRGLDRSLRDTGRAPPPARVGAGHHSTRSAGPGGGRPRGARIVTTLGYSNGGERIEGEVPNRSSLLGRLGGERIVAADAVSMTAHLKLDVTGPMRFNRTCVRTPALRRRDAAQPAQGGADRMTTVKLGPRDASGISELLRELGKEEGMPEGLRRDAAAWAGSVRRRMDQRDLRMVAWLFRDASGLGSVPPSCQDDARYWASYLEGRLEPL